MAAFCIGAVCAPLHAQTYTFSNYASIYSTTGVAITDTGTVYATAFHGNIIYRFSASGAATRLAGTGSFGSNDGAGNVARFSNPRAVAVDRTGNLYVADTGNHTVRKITPDGVVTTLAGFPGGRGWEDGTGSAARFDTPQGIAVDAAGNVYVADTHARSIRKITPTGVVTTLAGLGYVTGALDGTGLEALFNVPQGITVAANGDVFVADTGNHTIRKITPAGVVTTLAGLRESRGFTDGTGNSARFDSPQALAVDAAGTLFVADTGNNLIRKITPAGVVTTIGGLAGFTSDIPGVGSAARFIQSRGIAVAANGVVLVADSFSLKSGAPSNQLAITVQPQSQSVGAGSAARFSITATGAAPLSYQWQKDGTPIAGATASTFAIASVQAGSSGSYTVTVTNPVGIVTSTAAALVVLSPQAADNFADAQIISGASGQVSGNNNGATGEPLEPTHVIPAATASSVWYRWTAPENGTAIFDYSGNFTAATAVYTGASLGALTRISHFNMTRLSFIATAGTTYFIAVGSASPGARGNFTLTWRIIVNDAFAQAHNLVTNSGTLTGNNNGATGEPGEPQHLIGSTASSTSLWYRWTPTEDGLAALSYERDGVPVTFAAYTGASLATVTRVPYAIGVLQSSSSTPITYFQIRAGTTYHIAVGSSSYSTGTFRMNWFTTHAPIITQQTGGGTFSTGATATLGVAAFSATPARFQWTRDGVAITGATRETLVLSDLQPSQSGTYRVTVSNSSASSAVSTHVPVTVLIPPPNDNFLSAQVITGLSGSVTGTTVNATGQSSEPTHWNASGTQSSVWYRWTPATSGLAIVDTVGSNFDTVLAVYTGSELGTLTRITQDDDRGGGRTSQVTFSATTGIAYHIAVGSNYGTRGNLTLSWQISPTLAIATSPTSQTIAIGGSATFSVQATGVGVRYQWNRNGVAIPGATSPSLTVAGVQSGSDASYTVTLTNSGGSITSSPATLAVAAPSLTNLAIRNTRAGGSLLWGIAANGSTMVAVGNAGAIISSQDNGRTWTPRTSGTTSWIVGVTYGAGQFVAVADAGLILTSPDGTTWTPAPSSGTTQRLNNVIFANDTFVAVGEGGTIVTSTDARIWTPRFSGTTNWLHGLAYNASIGHFATCGQGGTILFSPDGVRWTKLPVAGLTVNVEAIVAVDSYAQFVAIGHNGTAVGIHREQLILKTGETLITWSGELTATGTTADLVGLTTGAGALFATGSGGKVITATNDKGPWTALPSGTTGILLAGMFHNNSLTIVGENEIAIQSDPLFSSRLINISTRGQVGTGSSLMISGFVITGTLPKPVLIRAAGPTLAASFGLTGTLTAPVLTLVDSQNRNVATNTGWTTAANSTAIVSTAARVGAFPFAANSADSAILTTLMPGAYTTLVSGVNNATGLSIVEVYDADPLSNEGSRAINISTRGVAGSGQNKMIAGFVIDGASSRRVLIRAVGPGIAGAPFNVDGTLTEPQIELYNTRNLLHATAGAWGLQANADEIRGSAKAVSAFDLPDGSKDSAMVVTLLPGAWTVQVGGPGTTTGVVLVEVYALP